MSLAADGLWIAGVFAGMVAIGTVGGSLVSRARVRRLVAARPGEGFDTFAQALQSSSDPPDPLIVRTVWEELQPWVTAGRMRAPLRPEDRLDDLMIDAEDVHDYLLPSIAARFGLSLDETTRNPWHGRVDTVGNLVRFVNAQPRRTRAGEAG
jgi:hypothetical protein